MRSKRCKYWNPAGLHSFPQDHINPADFMHIESPSLVSDVKVFCQNFVTSSGSANAEYFESRAQAFLEAVILTIVYLDGKLTLPRLYEVLSLMPGNSDAWLSFAFDMQRCGFQVSKAVEEEIAASRGNSSNGFQGIVGTVMKAVAPLSDPMLMASVSPPFTASMADLCGDKPTNIYLMPPAEFLDSWAPIIKALLVAGMIYKSRKPQVTPQTWVLDECAQLGKFPLVTRLFTYGAGVGIRPLAVYQSLDQMKATGPDAQNIIPASAACQSWFGVRDFETARRLSSMLGHETLEFDQELSQGRAELGRREAIDALLSGDDPFAVGRKLGQLNEAATHRSKQQRLLKTPDEILNMSDKKQVIFADGLDHPIWADRKPYYEQRFMAGRFHPNPYHPPADKVRVKRFFWHQWRDVVRERVPERYADLPQYADGYWSKVRARR